MSNRKAVFAALLAGMLALTGCEELEDDSARAAVNLVDRRTDAIASGADIESINGTYTGCTNRTGSWSLAVTGSPALDHGQLSVIKGDVGCALAITQLHTTSLGMLSASAPITLGTAFGTARSFGTPIEFYANAMVGSLDFGNNFSLTLLFADDVRTASGSNTADYATVSASSATAQGVAAPNYTLDLSGVTVLTDVSGTTSTVVGNVALTAGSQTGDSYLIVNGSVADTYAAIHSTFSAGSPVAMATSIAGSAFLANGVSLTGGQVRTLIIAKIQNGVASYQKLTITFNPPV